MKQDGRESSIWDVFSHTANKTAGGQTGDVADDSYNLYAVDIELMKAMDLPAFRFSLSWSRIIHANGSVNQAGIAHYNDLINALLDANIEPYVTLYHWDLPTAYSSYVHGAGGDWLNSSYIVPLFTHYADVAFGAFGDRVKYWLTFNEPLTFCFLGYQNGIHAPGRCSDRSTCWAGNSITEPYLCIHSVNLAHAHASHVYRTKYQSTQKGKIGITLSVGWSEPATDSAADKQASDISLQFDFSAWADPIWFGDYPAVMRENCGKLLPAFTDAEKKLLKGSSDFQGVNFYTASYVSAAKRGTPGSGWYVDRNASNSAVSPNGTVIGKQADSPWLYIVPWGLHKMLNWIGDRYGNAVELVVTENGMDVVNENNKPLEEALHDSDRIAYLSSYIGAMGDSITDGYNVTGYFVWSLMDNYEWADGYSKRFGIHYVDYNNSLARYPKDSAKWYTQLIVNTTGNARRQAREQQLEQQKVGGGVRVEVLKE